MSAPGIKTITTPLLNKTLTFCLLKNDQLRCRHLLRYPALSPNHTPCLAHMVLLWKGSGLGMLVQGLTL